MKNEFSLILFPGIPNQAVWQRFSQGRKLADMYFLNFKPWGCPWA
jgi:hypothetical protein